MLNLVTAFLLVVSEGSMGHHMVGDRKHVYM
jgi:hypothetical protein